MLKIFVPRTWCTKNLSELVTNKSTYKIKIDLLFPNLENC